MESKCLNYNLIQYLRLKQLKAIVVSRSYKNGNTTSEVISQMPFLFSCASTKSKLESIVANTTHDVICL